MYYTIYKTTNIFNDKIYIGKHKTMDPNDHYLGSGKLIIYAIKKYGRENFIKEVLFIFDNEVEMNNKEKEIINEEFLARNDVYNIGLGGQGGALRFGKFTLATRLKMKQAATNRIRSNESKQKQSKSIMGINNHFYGKKHSKENRLKISISSKLRCSGRGNPNAKAVLYNNTEYGTIKELSNDINLSLYRIRKLIKSGEVRLI